MENWNNKMDAAGNRLPPFIIDPLEQEQQKIVKDCTYQYKKMTIASQASGHGI
jgi:hypothetical protein